MAWLWIGVLLIASVSGAGAQDFVKKATAQAYVDCVREHANTLDDSRSDVRSVAAAAISLCRGERLLALQERDGIDAARAQQVVGALRETDLDMASAIVLQERRKGH